MNVLRMPQWLKEIGDTHGVADDFHWYISPHQWTNLAADAGTTAPALAAGNAAVGGVLTMASGTTDNNEVGLATTTAVFRPTAGRPLFAEGLIQFTEAATSAANVAFGLASGFGADLLVDNGAGPRASGALALIYKVDGETVWRFVTRNGSAVTVSQSLDTAGGAAFQRLAIEVVDVLADTCTVVPTVDGRQLRNAATNQPIVHQLGLASLAAMQLCAYLKCGSTTSETLLVDYLGCAQAR